MSYDQDKSKNQQDQNRQKIDPSKQNTFDKNRVNQQQKQDQKKEQEKDKKGGW